MSPGRKPACSSAGGVNDAALAALRGTESAKTDAVTDRYEHEFLQTSRFISLLLHHYSPLFGQYLKLCLSIHVFQKTGRSMWTFMAGSTKRACLVLQLKWGCRSVYITLHYCHSKHAHTFLFVSN